MAQTSDHITVSNTKDGWHQCHCGGCDATYVLPKEEGGTLAIWAMVALMEAFATEHRDCGETESDEEE